MTEAETEQLQEELTKLFKKFKVPMDGVYSDDNCRQPCCYPDAERDERAATAIEKLFAKKNLPRPYVGVGDISSVSDLVLRAKRTTCTHVWITTGPSSNTSSGIRDRQECRQCGAVQYGEVQGISAGGRWGWL